MKAKYLAIASLLAVISYGVFERVRPTSATMCNSKNYTVKIIDQRAKVPSVEAVSEPNFKSFIKSITAHVQAKGESSCVELIFVRVPLVASTKAAIADAVTIDMRSPLKCQLDSPWAKLEISRSKVPLVRGVFIWNERQFLVDQALMSRVQVSPAQPAKQIDRRTFEGYVKDYTDAVLLAPSPQAQSAAQASIEKRLPPEILWLFRNAWQSTRGPFSTIVDSALRTTMGRSASGYTSLNKNLVDQCFAGKTEIRYKTVLDLKKVFSIEKYRINRLY